MLILFTALVLFAVVAITAGIIALVVMLAFRRSPPAFGPPPRDTGSTSSTTWGVDPFDSQASHASFVSDGPAFDERHSESRDDAAWGSSDSGVFDGGSSDWSSSDSGSSDSGCSSSSSD